MSIVVGVDDVVDAVGLSARRGRRRERPRRPWQSTGRPAWPWRAGTRPACASRATAGAFRAPRAPPPTPRRIHQAARLLRTTPSASRPPSAQTRLRARASCRPRSACTPKWRQTGPSWPLPMPSSWLLWSLSVVVVLHPRRRRIERRTALRRHTLFVPRAHTGPGRLQDAAPRRPPQLMTTTTMARPDGVGRANRPFDVQASSLWPMQRGPWRLS